MKNNLEVTDVLIIVKQVEAYKGKYVKQVLGGLEKLGPLDPRVRKIVLDGFNDLSRAVSKEFGFTVEQ